jgi:hypothetical protein
MPVLDILPDVRPTVDDQFATSTTALLRQTALCSVQHPYPESFFTNLLSDYEKVVYPVNPVITSREIADSIQQMRSDTTRASLVYAFAVVTINLSQTPWQLDREKSSTIRDLMWRSRCAQHRVDPDDPLREMPISIPGIVTCIFMEICMLAFKRYDQSFATLREAIAMIQMLRVHRNGVESKLELARRQRLYSEMFVHERFLTIMGNYPCILTPLCTGMPPEDPTIPRHVDVGFSLIVRLFHIMDDDFLAHWAAQDGRAQAPCETDGGMD